MDAVARIALWLRTTASPGLLVLHGRAGVGKKTVARSAGEREGYTVACLWEEDFLTVPQRHGALAPFLCQRDCTGEDRSSLSVLCSVDTWSAPAVTTLRQSLRRLRESALPARLVVTCVNRWEPRLRELFSQREAAPTVFLMRDPTERELVTSLLRDGCCGDPDTARQLVREHLETSPTAPTFTSLRATLPFLGGRAGRPPPRLRGCEGGGDLFAVVRGLLTRGLRTLPAPSLSLGSVALLFDAPVVRACAYPLESLVQENYPRAPGADSVAQLAEAAEAVATADTVRGWGEDTRFLRRFHAVLLPTGALAAAGGDRWCPPVRMPGNTSGHRSAGLPRLAPESGLGAPARTVPAVSAAARAAGGPGVRGQASSSPAPHRAVKRGDGIPPPSKKRGRRASTRPQSGQTVNMLRFLTRR